MSPLRSLQGDGDGWYGDQSLGDLSTAPADTDRPRTLDEPVTPVGRLALWMVDRG